MEKLHVLFVLNFLSLVLVSSSEYTTPTKYFINCGSESNFSLADRTFVGDKNFDPSIRVGDSSDIRTDNTSLTLELYKTARIYHEPSSYVVNIDESGTYIVRFHFFPFISQGIDLSKGTFNVSARPFLFLSNFSVRNSSSLPVIREYFLNITSGKFQVDFVPENTSFAFVNAIEVFLLSPNFTVDYALAVPPVVAVPNSDRFYGVQSNALLTVYRLNVGGENVSDTRAFWRTWLQDGVYIISNGSAENRSTPITLNQDPGSTENIAPPSVYGSCRLVSGNGSSITNLTWQFQVKRNARHFLRLHFCDIVSISLNVDLAFNVYIYSEFNLTVRPSYIVSKTATPFFYDLVFDSDKSGYVNISIAPMEDSVEKIAFLNGLEIMEFVSNTSFALPPPKSFALPSPKKENHHLFVVIGSVTGAALVIVLIVLFLIGLKCRKSKSQKAFHAKSEASHSWITEKPGYASPIPNLNLKLKMPLAEILTATQNFDTKLLIGEGGFGRVYKGSLQDGMKVAVKRSDSRYGQGIYEFQTEILVLSKIRHRHLVSLIGYCDDGNEMILVYEFMEKGTLRDHLYDWKENPKTNGHSQTSELTWKQRLEICIGAAKGLHYLHTGSDGGIIHRDVKSTNILLDEEYVAKVADFGLSRSGPSDADHFSTEVKGSFGYLDPEYFRTYQLTDKSDVYSFGVVLLEVLCARQPIVNSTQKEEINLAEWGMYWLKKGQLEKIMDPSLVGQINPNSLKKFGEIVEKCLKPEGADRPSMLDVCWDLEYALQLQKAPVHREPDEDSTTCVSSNIILPIQHFNSNIFTTQEGAVVIDGDNDSDLSANGVFSQYSISGAR